MMSLVECNFHWYSESDAKDLMHLFTLAMELLSHCTENKTMDVTLQLVFVIACDYLAISQPF